MKRSTRGKNTPTISGFGEEHVARRVCKLDKLRPIPQASAGQLKRHGKGMALGAALTLEFTIRNVFFSS